MIPRGYCDLLHRIRDTPARFWCVTVHRKLWKIWRVGYARHDHGTSLIFFCRLCGREYPQSRG